jgi:hypothetical protein
LRPKRFNITLDRTSSEGRSILKRGIFHDQRSRQQGRRRSLVPRILRQGVNLAVIMRSLIAEGYYVVGQWEGGGTHTRQSLGRSPAYEGLPAPTGSKMHFTGKTVLKARRIFASIRDACTVLVRASFAFAPEA